MCCFLALGPGGRGHGNAGCPRCTHPVRPRCSPPSRFSGCRSADAPLVASRRSGIPKGRRRSVGRCRTPPPYGGRGQGERQLRRCAAARTPGSHAARLPGSGPSHSKAAWAGRRRSGRGSTALTCGLASCAAAPSTRAAVARAAHTRLGTAQSVGGVRRLRHGCLTPSLTARTEAMMTLRRSRTPASPQSLYCSRGLLVALGVQSVPPRVWLGDNLLSIRQQVQPPQPMSWQSEGRW
ncbi:hypothetical protein FB465_6761 [Kitasatospora atroaurantiaca]|uniref:Uncharacterized protein n=1 Tax=Kitasatospora atroaurantiaca TaxID=285545 RepID=A0A561F134_9ACTN|nr:hypothetical protein FB465_6761 [Kitasatospora atroaurantiaca]